MGKIRVGIIGCGGIANGKHMPAIKEAGRADIVAFCDLIIERAQRAKKDYGTEDAKVFKDYKDLIKEDLDAVYVCTPNRYHSVITVDALHAGLNVMCEKPMAINYTEAQKMIAAQKESGKLLTIGYQNRYRPDSLCLKKICESGELGDIYYAKAKAIRRRAVPTWGVFLNEYEQGGGPLIDIGTHALDLTLWTMNNYKPKYVVGTVYHKLNDLVEQGNAWDNWDPAKFTVEDSAFGFIVMEDCATITLESSWALNSLDINEAKTVLCGTKAGADMEDGLRVNGVSHNTKYVQKYEMDAGGAAFFEGKSNKPEVVEQNVFMDALEGKGELTVLPEQAATVTRILDAIYESGKTGEPVYF